MLCWPAGSGAQETEVGNLYHVPLLESASGMRGRHGFIRIENLSLEGGEVSITAFEDDGTRHGPIALRIDAGKAVNLNATDVERGNPAKGIEGIGQTPDSGRWRLELESGLDLRILRYMRTDEGFLTSLEPVPRLGGCLHRIHTFNPGRNDHQVSILRLINPGEEAVRVHIRGTDDTGAPSSGTASLTVLPGTARHLTSQELESGEADGLEGALGEGTGKWRLNVASDGAIQVMNLLASPTGHLASFSAEGVSGDVNIEGRVASLRQHGDNIIVAEIRGCVNRSEIDFAHVAKAVVARYGDEFDFIFMTSNLDSIRENQRYGYHGRYFRVQNQVEGIGVSTGPYAIFAQIYGGRTQGRLKGLIHFTYRDGILWGPGLHEIMHAWANYIIDVGSRIGAHWGFSSANGQLGGFAIENLVDRGNDEYTAGRFGTFANGGNSVPYSPIELYLAGWVGPAEVPDLWLGKNAHWVIEGGKFKQNEKGEFVFRAPEVEIWSIERIIAQHGGATSGPPKRPAQLPWGLCASGRRDVPGRTRTARHARATARGVHPRGRRRFAEPVQLLGGHRWAGEPQAGRAR